MDLTRFDSVSFLRDYWQKRPLLIRSPWDAWVNPLAPDELAGLACEQGIEARLITRAGADWRAEHGPFSDARFGRTAREPWTLLVQAVDHYVPEVAALLEAFRFIPNWRIDDVMVSYASDGGGVGPHFDNYDVFLIQGLGQRRWRLGQFCNAGSELLPRDDVRLLADFQASDEWVLSPGDILYVPPGVAHDGVALGDDCMTYSIGFRAPSRAQLVSNWCDHMLDELQEDDRYTDPELEPAANPGEISPAALARLHAMVAEKLLDGDAFARWFGEYSSTPKYPDIDWAPEQQITTAQLSVRLSRETMLCRNPASRFAFVRRLEGAVLMFVDGECFECGAETSRLAERLCASSLVSLGPEPGLSPAVLELVAELFNRGSLAFANDETAL